MELAKRSLASKVGGFAALAGGAGLLTALLACHILGRSAQAEEKPVAETARLEKSNGEIQTPAPKSSELFAREKFDPSVLRIAKNGAFVIRVGDIFRDPRFAPYVPIINTLAPLTPLDNVKSVDGFDLGAIEWIAGNLAPVVKPPAKGKSATFMVGLQHLVIRLNRPVDLQEMILDRVEHASLETHQGRNYVKLLAPPPLGPGEMVLRFPDDKTIVALFGFNQDTDEVRKKVLKHLFDDSPAQYDWADAWRRSDGGLITLVADNRNLGWSKMAGSGDALVEAALPAVEKPEFFGVGLDWNHKTDRLAVRVDGFCADQAVAQEVYLKTLALLDSLRRQLSEQSDDPNGEDDEDVSEMLESAHVRLGDESSEPALVETTFEATAAIPALPEKTGD